MVCVFCIIFALFGCCAVVTIVSEEIRKRREAASRQSREKERLEDLKSEAI
jgi:hypothetical protein